MDWRVSRPARSRVRRIVAAVPIAAVLVCVAFGRAAAEPAAGDSARWAPEPPLPATRSAEWETLAAGLPEEARLGAVYRLRYNRADGPAILAGLAVHDELQRRPLLEAVFGYAFSRERGLGSAEGNLPLGRRHRVLLGGSLYRRTATKDAWIVGEAENTIFALLARTDDRDHYEAEGFEAHVQWRPGSDVGLSAGGVVETQRPLRTRTRVALTGHDDRFRENPAIDRGDDGLVWGEGRIGPEAIPARGGSRVVVRYERSGDPIDRDFDYARIRIQGNWRQRVGRGQTARLRVIVGSTRSGSLPLQRVWDLGGIGTLRGTPFKRFHGDQLFLANAEWALRARKNLDAFAFLDWGAAWFGRDRWNDARPTLDGGVGLRVGEGPLAVTLARNLQRSDAPFLVGVRLGGTWE